MDSEVEDALAVLLIAISIVDGGEAAKRRVAIEVIDQIGEAFGLDLTKVYGPEEPEDVEA